MELIALGTGSAFTLHRKNFQTNFVLQKDGKRFLVDCGSDIRWSLKASSLTPFHIDAVYVSHLHADHIGGLEFLGYTRYFARQKDLAEGKPNPTQLPILLCDPSLRDSLWRALEPGMSNLDDKVATLDDYFQLHTPSSYFWWQGVLFKTIRAPHVGHRMPSFGLLFGAGKKTYITTDVAFDASLDSHYDEADLIIQDCQTEGRCNVHPAYEDLRSLPPEVKAKMLLAHYQDNVLEDWNRWQSIAKEDGFQGFLWPGDVLHL